MIFNDNYFDLYNYFGVQHPEVIKDQFIKNDIERKHRGSDQDDF